SPPVTVPRPAPLASNPWTPFAKSDRCNDETVPCMAISYVAARPSLAAGTLKRWLGAIDPYGRAAIDPGRCHGAESVAPWRQCGRYPALLTVGDKSPCWIRKRYCTNKTLWRSQSSEMLTLSADCAKMQSRQH